MISLETQDNTELDAVRKLIQTYVKEELGKLQPKTEEQHSLRSPMEKQRTVRSGSTKTSKSQKEK